MFGRACNLTRFCKPGDVVCYIRWFELIMQLQMNTRILSITVLLCLLIIELPNPCKPKPCQNGGECVVLGNRYSCRCKPEFGGVHCEHGQCKYIIIQHYLIWLLLLFGNVRRSYLDPCHHKSVQKMHGHGHGRSPIICRT